MGVKIQLCGLRWTRALCLFLRCISAQLPPLAELVAENLQRCNDLWPNFVAYPVSPGIHSFLDPLHPSACTRWQMGPLSRCCDAGCEGTSHGSRKLHPSVVVSLNAAMQCEAMQGKARQGYAV